jgi:hypothetical protein
MYLNFWSSRGKTYLTFDKQVLFSATAKSTIVQLTTYTWPDESVISTDSQTNTINFDLTTVQCIAL